MSFELTAAVLRHSRLPCLEQIVLAHLADAADKNGVSYWSQEKLAERAGMPVRTFRLQIKKLRDAGLITVKRTNLTNIYTVLFRESGDAGQARAASRNAVKDESDRQELPHGQARAALRTGTTCLTDRQELPLNRSEKKPEKKPENPFASAAANAGEDDSLFPIEPPQPKPPKERKPKPETSADPRHHEITSRIGAAFSEVMEVPFIFSARFAKELATFLKQYPGTADEFLAMYQQMLKAGRMPYANATKKAADPCFLARNWNACVVELENIAGQYLSQPKKR